MAGFSIKALKQINNGLGPDDGTGDTLRTGAEIINDNFDVTKTVVNSQAAVDVVEQVGNGVQVNSGSGASVLGGSQTLNANSVAIAAALNYLAISQASGALVSYLTKADMDADLAHDDGVMALVTNDPTAENNQSWRKSGASGGGSWEITVDRMAVVLGNGAGFQQSGTGSQIRSFQDKDRDVRNLFDNFTATEKTDALSGNPAIDTTAKIQAAIDNAVVAGQRLVAYGTFRITAKVVIKGDADFSQAVFQVYGAPPIAVEVSTGSANNPTDRLYFKSIWLPKQVVNMTKPTTGWAGQGVGVRLVNLNNCTVYFGAIRGFRINAQTTAYTVGNVYNHYFLSNLDTGQINLDITTGDAGGWCNQNTYYGGYLGIALGEGNQCPGTRHIRINNTNQLIDNNLFINTSLEGQVPEYHIENAGAYNVFLNCRFEEQVTLSARVLYNGSAGHGNYNTIMYGYFAQRVVVTNDPATTHYNTVISGTGVNVVDGNSSSALNLECNRDASGGVISLGFAPDTADPLTHTNWSYSLGSANLQGKTATDGYHRIMLDFANGAIGFSDGTVVNPRSSIFYGSGLQCTTTFNPALDDTADLGNSIYRWQNGWFSSGIGFFGSAPPNAKPMVSGSKGGNAALASLISALSACGIIGDNTT